MLLLLLAVLLLLPASSRACTGLLVADGKEVLAGNNEDFWTWDTKVWFVPAVGKRHGCVFFGFDTVHPQGGMNTAGLFYDGFAAAPLAVLASLDRERFKGNLIKRAMRECATVAEVIALFERYNLAFLERAMLMFGDRTGDSVIIEGDVFVRKRGRYQVTTNFYQSRCKEGAAPCPRYQIACELLEAHPEASVGLVRRVLASVCNEGKAATQYSNIYDLKRGIVYLYHFHNFENCVTLDLAAELEKGAHAHDIPALFPRSYAFEAFKTRQSRERDEERRRRRMRAFDPAWIDDYPGYYRVEEGPYKGAFLLVSREENTLVLRASGEGRLEFIPEARDRFFQFGRYGSVDLGFERDASGAVCAVIRKSFAHHVRARKLPTRGERSKKL